MKNKDEMFSKLKEFKAFIENHTNGVCTKQQCVYRTMLHIEYLRTRLLKKSSPARNQRRHFQVVRERKKESWIIIHSDVCGPMSSSSLTGYVYYVSFIDDFLGRRGFTS